MLFGYPLPAELKSAHPARKGYIPFVIKIMREAKKFFLAASIAAMVLRLIFIFRFPSVTTDSFIYGDIAKNWLQHGIYGITNSGEIIPTYIRVPGYPAFLATVFAIFGVEHYRAVLMVQMFIDIGTCLLIADLARRSVGDRACKAAFLLAALCPFTANYVAAALTETLEIFFTALSLNLALVGLESENSQKFRYWVGCGLSTGAAMVLRPDGGILLAALELFLVVMALKRLRSSQPILPTFHAALIVAIISFAPLIPWTLRNLHTMHRFQPLAPRYANEENEFVPMGFNRWVKTWIADYTSSEEVYWLVPGAPLDSDKLPGRAFDSPQQSDQTQDLMDDYNSALHVTPELDSRFASLASVRIRQSPVRYYLWLPALRIADMWLRPRTEMLPSDSRWWEFDDEPKWSALAVGLGLIGVFYVTAGLAGFLRRPSLKYSGLLIAFVVIRSLFLGTMESPEPRYTLECYPVVILYAATWFQKCDRSRELT